MIRIFLLYVTLMNAHLHLVQYRGLGLMRSLRKLVSTTYPQDFVYKCTNRDLVWGNTDNLIQSHVNTMANHILKCNDSIDSDRDRCNLYKRGLAAVPVPDPLDTNVPSSSIIVARSLSRAPSEASLAPSDSYSSGGLRPGRRTPALSRQGSTQDLSRHHSSPGITPDMLPPSENAISWTPAKTKRFRHLICRLTASAGFPLSWVENPEWQTIREEFIPGAPHIGRDALTRTILPELVAEFRAEARQFVNSKDVTMQSDGWTGLNNRHLIAFMITCDKRVCNVLLIYCLIEY